MSGYLRAGHPLPPSPYTTAPGLAGAQGHGAPHSSQAFASVLASSPSPAPIPPQAGFQDPARSAPLIPLANQLTVPPGSHFAGRVLAAGDVSVGSWPQVTARTAQPAATAASADRVVAICPPDRMSPRAPAWA